MNYLMAGMMISASLAVNPPRAPELPVPKPCAELAVHLVRDVKEGELTERQAVEIFYTCVNHYNGVL